MPLRFYNTFTKREEDFVPAKAGIVTMYTCGPTVYGRPHIGNYSSFLMADLLRRWLEVGHGYAVKYAKNITDVGHLISDADEGEDKIQKEAEKEKTDPLAIAKRYTEMYVADEKALNLKEPSFRPRATEYVKEMLAIIKTLVEKGNAYETNDGVYFSVETFKDYGKLSGNTLDHLNAGARIAVDEAKKHPADFALWKKCVGGNGRHLLRWSFATGERTATQGEDAQSGFPGWHIECSAMSSALLGAQIDIHTGGEDNIFPHHECEIAQSECSSGSAPFVRLWLHKRRIDLQGEKMSKSLGNVLTISSVQEKGYSALDLRFYLLSVHYRTNLKFSWEGMDEAHQVRRSILEWMEKDGAGSFSPFVSEGKKLPEATPQDIEKFDADFSAAFDADLNVSGALAAVHGCIHTMNSSRSPNQSTRDALKLFIQKIRDTFGCFDPEVAADIPAAVTQLKEQRAAARAAKDFAASDRLRDEIKNLGYEVRDEGKEQKIKKL